MAAPLGNKNALGNKGGCPPIWSEDNEKDVLEVYRLCESYFEYIKGDFDEDEFELPSGKFEVRKEIKRNPEPPTVTGLALYIGFESKSTLYEYAKKVKFSYPIKRALSKIEQYHEMAISMGDKCTGNIFALKNMGWHDTVKTDVTTQGEKINTPPVTISFKKFEENE